MFGILSNLLGRGKKRDSEAESSSDSGDSNSTSTKKDDDQEQQPPSTTPSGSRKKVKLSTGENTDDDPSAVLKGELGTIQRSMTNQIENLGNKFKEIEDSGKKRDEENKNLKDLLYRGSMEIQTEKDKSDDLREKNKQLMELLKLTEKNIEDNMKQSAQLLEVTRAKVRGEVEISGEGKSKSVSESEVTFLGEFAPNPDLTTGVSDINLMSHSELCLVKTETGEPLDHAILQRRLSDSRKFLENCACMAVSGLPLNLSGNKSNSNAENPRPASRFLNPVIVNSTPTQAILSRPPNSINCNTNPHNSVANGNPPVITINSENPLATKLVGPFTTMYFPNLAAAAAACGVIVPVRTTLGAHGAKPVSSTSTQTPPPTRHPVASTTAASAINSGRPNPFLTTSSTTTTHSARANPFLATSTAGAGNAPSRNPAPSTSTPSTDDSSSDSEPSRDTVEEAFDIIQPEPIDESLSFSALSGLEDQVKVVRENILFPLVNKDALQQCGVELVKGLIFSGPVGSGKLLVAKTLTAELSRVLGKQFSFFRRHKTDVFSRHSEKGKKFLRSLFQSAKAKEPAVIFLDDLDTLCCYMEYLGPVDTLVKSVSLQMETVKSDLIIVIAATNELSKVDSSLRRHGCFDKTVIFPVPNFDRRKAILTAHSAQWKQRPSDEILDEMAKKTTDWSSDDMEDLCRQSFLLALHRQFLIGDNNAKDNEKDASIQKLDSTAIDAVKVIPEDWTSAFSSITKSKNLTSASAKSSCGSQSNTEEAIAPEIIDESLGFDSVGGLEEQMQSVRENILFPMLNKAALLDWGVEPVRGIIFHGPPGTGKTLLAKALAAELSRLGDQPFSFFYRKGTDSFQKYVGWTESYLRTLFAKAVAKKPAILFFDEIDGLCSTRKEGGNSSFYNGIVTTMLGLLDGVKRGELFVIAATNRLDSLDPALTRPGRFDKTVAFFPPKEEGRKTILGIHSSKWKRGRDEKILAEIAKQTEGYTGADLEQLCRQTFLSALRRQFPTLGKTDFTVSTSGFDEFDILLQDWYTAIGTVKGSNNSAFGNSVSSGKAIPPGVSRLISGIEKEIVEKLKPFLKAAAAPYLPGEEKSGGIKSFLIWDTGIRQARIIEHFIVPSLTSSGEFKDTTTFTLGDDKIEASNLKSFMNQILTCSKTAILYIPRVDQLGTKLANANTLHLFMEHMDSLRGENVLLLASAGCPISELPEDLRLIFKGMANSRAYKVRKFETSECREFFTPILQEPLLSRAESLAHGANFYDILDLKSELSQACTTAKEKEFTEDQIAENLAGILDSFEANKLDNSGPRNHMYS